MGATGGAATVTVVSASAGSGKTVLLRSWIAEAGLADRVAWVPAGRADRDPQRFWLSVLGALRTTSAGSALVPAQVTELHEQAAGWLAAHGYPVEAIRHAQAAQDWEFAARLLADHWPGLHLDGQDATVHALLAGFPPAAPAADPELAAVAAADELADGSMEAAERYLVLAEEGSASVPAARRGRVQVLLGWSGCYWPTRTATLQRYRSMRGNC